MISIEKLSIDFKYISQSFRPLAVIALSSLNEILAKLYMKSLFILVNWFHIMKIATLVETRTFHQNKKQKITLGHEFEKIESVIKA